MRIRDRLSGAGRRATSASGRPLRSAGPASRPGELPTVRSSQLVWIFGSPRTGSTWLSRMMGRLAQHQRWNEPHIGELFGGFHERTRQNTRLRGRGEFVFSDEHRDAWLAAIREFVLASAAVRFPTLGPTQSLVIKEPNGSIGASVLLAANPDSRLIFLLRDSRDVVASRLDAFREGSWTNRELDYSSAEKLLAATRDLANDYLKVVSHVAEAYEAHPGPKALVRYEDLRVEPVDRLVAMYAALGLTATRAEIEAAVAAEDWERIPEDRKGSGTPFRKAQPGGWVEDLTPEQVALVEATTEPILRRYYGDERADGARPAGSAR